MHLGEATFLCISFVDNPNFDAAFRHPCRHHQTCWSGSNSEHVDMAIAVFGGHGGQAVQSTGRGDGAELGMSLDVRWCCVI